MDGITLSVIRWEMKRYLPLKIQKVQQRGKRELVLSLWARGVRERLVMSLEGPESFFGFAEGVSASGESAKPSGFCLALRKRLEGGSLLDVRQEGLDRVLYLDFEGHDDFGGRTQYVLVFDLAGQGQNIGLYKDGLLEAAILPPGTGRFEAGEPYTPPASGRIDIRRFAERRQAPEVLGRLLPRDVPAQEALSSTVEGLGKELAKSILFAAGQDPVRPFSEEGGRAAAAEILEIASGLYGMEGSGGAPDPIRPAVYLGPRGPIFHVFPLHHLEPQEEFPTALEGAKRYRALALEAREIASLRRSAESLLSRTARKLRSKLEAQMQDLSECRDLDKYKRWAELIDMSGKRNPPGASDMTAIDYYQDPPAETVVPLDPRYSSRGNARNYYRFYAKLVRRQKALKESIGELEGAMAGLERARLLLSGALTAAEIRIALAAIQELARPHGIFAEGEQGLQEYARPKGSGSPSLPEAVETATGPDGALFFIGRNARQNDYIVTRLRRPGDIWLHTKGARGAHVLVRSISGGPVSERDLLAAAAIAARKSEAGSSSKVEVDYVDASRVMKPPGSPPGFVTYSGQKTIVVSPGQTRPEA